jgi:hypothetical protein
MSNGFKNGTTRAIGGKIECFAESAARLVRCEKKSRQHAITFSPSIAMRIRQGSAVQQSASASMSASASTKERREERALNRQAVA